jgi:hypothetical protein
MLKNDEETPSRVQADQSLQTMYKILSDVELDEPNQPDPWEQLENEPDVAYAAFKVYLFSSPRTYRRVVQFIYEENQKRPHPEENSDAEFLFEKHDIGLETSTILKEIENSVNTWSVIYNWKERTSKFDLYRDYADDIRKIQRRRKNVWKHLDIADTMLDKARERLEHLPAEALTPKILAEFVKTAVEIQRVSLGLSTQNIFGIKNVNVTVER